VVKGLPRTNDALVGRCLDRGDYLHYFFHEDREKVVAESPTHLYALSALRRNLL
jgi:hypothetical protein